MRKFYLLLFFIVLSFGVIKSSIHSRSIYNPYVQTQITKTIFDMKKYRTDWIETYSTKITFDFIDNSKIIIDSYNEKTIFNVKLKKIDIHENSRLYLMKGVDSYNNKYLINVIYFNDKSIFMTIQNDTSIIRYKMNFKY